MGCLSAAKLSRDLSQRNPVWYRLFNPTQSLVRGAIRLCAMQRVLTGPFRGMLYQPSSYAERPCLLGTYEKELHPLFGRVLEQPFDRVVEVGTRCGYYITGLAQWYPAARMIAFEADLSRHPRLRGNLRANGVLARVSIQGRCTTAGLRKSLYGGGRSLLVMDVEGGEVELLDPHRVEALRAAAILVETHEGLVPGCEALLRERFRDSHQIHAFAPQARTVDDFPLSFLKARWMGLQRAVVEAMSEHRDTQTGWLFLQPKGADWEF